MLKLSWDLFVIVIFAVIVAYSFIIGKSNTIKVIIGTYLSILAADGLGNLFKQYVLSSKQMVLFLKFFGLGNENNTLILIKVVVFIAAIVIISMKGGFEVHPSLGHRGGIGIITNLIFGFLSAGLVISTLLIYVSGASFVGGTVTLQTSTLASAYTDSEMVKVMIDNYNFWFAVPAVAFLLASLLHSKEQIA